MAIFNKCCCFSLRRGSIILAVFELYIVNLLWIVASYFSSGPFHATRHTSQYESLVKESAYYGLVGGNLLVWVSCGCLIHGACNANKLATVIYLFVAVIKIGLGVTAVVMLPFILCRQNNAEANLETEEIVVIALISIGFIPALLLSIYFWLCVYSLYRKIKKDELLLWI